MTVFIGIITIVLLASLVALVFASLRAVSHAENTARGLQRVLVPVEEPSVEVRTCK